jgi:hypothetical protein
MAHKDPIKRREYERKRYAQKHVQIRAKNLTYYLRNKELGLCVYGCKRKTDGRYAICLRCRLKRQEYDQARAHIRIQKRKELRDVTTNPRNL